MGSEYPRKGERRHTAVPIRHFSGIRTQRKSFSTTVSGGEVGTSRIPKSALTPNSRLRKFQKVRDRNLRNQVLDRNNLRKQFKMLEAVGSTGGEMTSQSSPESVKSMKRMGEDHGLNGISVEEKQKDVEVNGMESQTNGIETNGEVETYREDTLHEADEEIEVVEEEQEDLIEEEQQVEPPSIEDRELEVEVKVIESPSPSSSRRSTPRRNVTLPEPQVVIEPDIVSSEPFIIDDTWRSDSLRISGRGPIRGMTPPRKRKSDDYSNEPASKRQAFTPSLPSPGWKFLSPFSLFNRRTPAPASTRPDDSMFVNVSTDSETDLDLDDTTSLEQDQPTPTDPSAKPSWLCSIM